MVVDKFGRAINVDDVISYPLRRKSELWMTDMVVLGFDKGAVLCRERGSKNARKTRTKNVQNIIRVGHKNEFQEVTTSEG